MSTSLFDVFGRLLLEGNGAQFVADAKAAGGKAGDAVGQTMGQRVSAGLRSAVGTGARIVAGAAAAAFGIAAKGALELENATARYRAETGATAEEAARTGKIINEVAGRQRATLEAVTDVAIRVKRDLGAVGEEADKLTEDFVRFARVTRQDAAGAVSSFDDILDSWGLTAKDTQGLMDKLLVSQQKFGGSIEDNQRTLAALAPAMRAAGMEIDDGISLLGLFGAKGLDAQQASAAFAKALTKVKSPAELQALITDIQNTKDPFERASKAAELFGARAGAKLANALGGVNLEDYAIGMDEAAGATQKAADVLDSTFSAQLQRKISEIGAGLRGLGSDFGPLLTGTAALASLGGSLGLDKVLGKALGKLAGSALVKGAASKAGFFIGTVMSGAMFVGDKLGNALGGALNSLPGSSKVKAGMGKLGSFMGSGLGKALGVAFAAVAVLEVVNTYNQVKASLNEQTTQIGADIAHQIKSGTTAQLEQSKAAIQTGLKDLEGVWDFGLFTGDTRKALQAQLDATEAELEARAQGMGATTSAGVADGIDAGAPAVGDAADDLVDEFGEPIEEGADTAVRTVEDAMHDILTSIKGARAKLTGAASDAAHAIYDPIVAQAEYAATQREISEQKQILAAKDSTDEQKRDAQERLTDLRMKTVEQLALLVSFGDKAAADALQTQIDVLSSLDTLTTEQKLALQALQAELDATRRHADSMVDALNRPIARRSGAATPSAEGGHRDAGQLLLVGEEGPELWVPDVPGTVVPMGEDAGSTTQLGDVTNIFNLTVAAPSTARDPIGLVREFRRTVDNGLWPQPAPARAPA